MKRTYRRLAIVVNQHLRRSLILEILQHLRIRQRRVNFRPMREKPLYKAYVKALFHLLPPPVGCKPFGGSVVTMRRA